MVNVVVKRPRTIRVSANGTAGVLDSTGSVTLKNIPTVGTSGNLALEELNDVVSIDERTGDTLVYDSVTRKWVAQKLDMVDVTGTVDGGEF